METLLERMGGASAVIDAIEGLHDRMLVDDTLTPFLEGVDADVWSAKQFDFLGRMLDASDYDAQRLRVSHQRLVDAGLSDEHFDRTMDYLREALVDAEVPADCRDEVLAAFESTRADILCK